MRDRTLDTILKIKTDRDAPQPPMGNLRCKGRKEGRKRVVKKARLVDEAEFHSTN
jgi:hypothetical protein